MQGQKHHKTQPYSTDVDRHCHAKMRKWCVCVCVLGGVGWGLESAAVSNGSCLTGKRSICYNVNNDPSSYCAAWDKSIKDPSHPIITILCQQPAEGMRVMEREKTLRKWGWIPETQGFLWSCFAEQLFLLWHEMFLRSHRRAISFSFDLFFLAHSCCLFATVDL